MTRPSYRHPAPLSSADAERIERELSVLIAAARPGVLPPANDDELLERLLAEQTSTTTGEA